MLNVSTNTKQIFKNEIIIAACPSKAFSHDSANDMGFYSRTPYANLIIVDNKESIEALAAMNSKTESLLIFAV
jgi:hypothetical protein